MQIRRSTCRLARLPMFKTGRQADQECPNETGGGSRLLSDGMNGDVGHSSSSDSDRRAADAVTAAPPAVPLPPPAGRPSPFEVSADSRQEVVLPKALEGYGMGKGDENGQPMVEDDLAPLPWRENPLVRCGTCGGE